MRSACLVMLCALALIHSPGGAESLAEPSSWIAQDSADPIFTFEDGQLSAQRRSYQSATILTKSDYENFDLSFDFRLERWCELILLIHAPANAAWEAGLQLVLSDHHGSAPTPHRAGALLGHAAPASVAVNPAGEWNTCRIHVDWPTFRVTLNDRVVQDLDLSTHPELRYKLRRGPLGFRDLLGWGFQVRNMRLTRLADSENGLTLYNGKDFAGWREVRPRDAVWEANGPIITGKNGNGYLQHEYLVQDFDLRLYYRTTPTANGGVFFRWLTDDSDRGNEIQILDVPESVMPSASIYNIARANDIVLRPRGEWQLLQISVHGSHAVTHLNGIKAAETDSVDKVRPGHITLQMHKENSVIEFKDLVLVSHDS